MDTNKRLLTGIILSAVFLFINPAISVLIAGGTWVGASSNTNK